MADLVFCRATSGTFINPSSTYLIGSGIVLSTGIAADYGDGPNLDSGRTMTYALPATEDQELLLDLITGGGFDHFDVTQLDITFDMLPGFDTIFFAGVFGSEEFPEFVGSDFVDGFGVYLNGVNIASVGGLPVNINHPDMGVIAGPTTELDGVLAPGGNSWLLFSGFTGDGSIDNKLSFIIADTSDSSFDTTVYISGLGGIPPEPIPEPATLILLSLGLLGLGGKFNRWKIRGKNVNILVVFAVIAIMLTFSSPAKAEVIDFEDLFHEFLIDEELPANYGGFSWNDEAMFVIPLNSILVDPNLLGSGYEFGTTGLVSLFNRSNFLFEGMDISMARSIPFDFHSVDITAAWNNYQNVTVEGWRNGNLIYSQAIVTDIGDPDFGNPVLVEHPTFGEFPNFQGQRHFDFNFLNVDTVWFKPEDGVNAGLGGFGPSLVIDNVTYSPVPEPATLGFLGLGLLGMLFSKFSKPFKL